MDTKEKRVRLFVADSAQFLKKLPSNSVDAIITDPPAGISFMSKKWDDDKGGRDAWIEWLSSILKECHRILKPGGHALIWSIPRTNHWTGMAIENAGFEVRDVVAHMFGSGFPKSLDVSKAIDKQLGTEELREFKCKNPADRPYTHTEGETSTGWQSPVRPDKTHPYSEEAKKWEGYGTALKPSVEYWVLARKPIEGTVAQNVMKYGTGGLNIGGSRISAADQKDLDAVARRMTGDKELGWFTHSKESVRNSAQGRWPANVILSHSPLCKYKGKKEVVPGNGGVTNSRTKNESMFDFGSQPKSARPWVNENGKETVDDYECDESCPVKKLDEQTKNTRAGKPSGTGQIGDAKGIAQSVFGNDGRTTARYDDTGAASRFFKVIDEQVESACPFYYCAKASTRERNEGCEEKSNVHPTIKAIKLMSYLCKLITPPDGTILDPFMGSGSTGVAAIREGFKFIGIEQSKEYAEIAAARIRHEAKKKRP